MDNTVASLTLKKMLGIVGSPNSRQRLSAATAAGQQQQQRQQQQQQQRTPKRSSASGLTLSAQRSTSHQERSPGGWRSRSAPTSPSLPPRVSRQSHNMRDTQNRRSHRNSRYGNGNGGQFNNNNNSGSTQHRSMQPHQVSHHIPQQRNSSRPPSSNSVSKLEVLGPTCSLHVVITEANGVHRGSKYIQESQMYELFERYGEVHDITTGRQFHFVNFASVAGADNAYGELNGTSGSSLLEASYDMGEGDNEMNTRRTSLIDSSSINLFDNSMKDGEVHIQLQWALPRSHHPLYFQMQEIQERRRARRLRSAESNPPDTTTTTTTTAEKNNKEKLSAKSLENSTTTVVVNRRSRTSSSLGQISRDGVKGKRWADVADDMSDDGKEDDDTADGTVDNNERNRRKTNAKEKGKGKGNNDTSTTNEHIVNKTQAQQKPDIELAIHVAPALAGQEASDFQALMARRRRLSEGSQNINKIDGVPCYDVSFDQFLSSRPAVLDGNFVLDYETARKKEKKRTTPK